VIPLAEDREYKPPFVMPALSWQTFANCRPSKARYKRHAV
jgi:hypothetical protein